MDFERVGYVTRKQVNVIYMNAKSGNIKVERGFMTSLYNMTQPTTWTTDNQLESDRITVKAILDAIFSGNMEEAQNVIDEAQNKLWSLMGKKGRAAYIKETV